MTAAEHLAYADQLLSRVMTGDVPGDTESTLKLVQEAQAHALIAIADGLGIAHAPAAPGGADHAA